VLFRADDSLLKYHRKHAFMGRLLDKPRAAFELENLMTGPCFVTWKFTHDLEHAVEMLFKALLFRRALKGTFSYARTTMSAEKVRPVLAQSDAFSGG
jgi:hypothetical protein